MNDNGQRFFVAAPATTRIVFDDGPLCGLEVTMRIRLGIGELIRFVQAVENLKSSPASDDEEASALDVLSSANMTELAQVAEDAGAYLVSWNMADPTEDGGVAPVPATPDGWRSRDGTTQVLIFTKWAPHLAELANGAVSVPLASESPSGGPSQVLPETMGVS